MNDRNRRQYVLLALLGVAVVGYLRFGTDVLTFAGGTSVETLASLDMKSLEERIKDVSTVEPSLIPKPSEHSEADRNLFQYGAGRPKPPTPEELEAQRLAAQQQLEAQEQAARAAKEAEALRIERERIAQEQAQQNPATADGQPAQTAQSLPPPPPPAPPKPQPPPINFRFVGLMGNPKKPLVAFLNGSEVMLGRKGETLAGQFRLIEVGPEWVLVGYTDPAFKGESKKLELGL